LLNHFVKRALEWYINWYFVTLPIQTMSQRTTRAAISTTA